MQTDDGDLRVMTHNQRPRAQGQLEPRPALLSQSPIVHAVDPDDFDMGPRVVPLDPSKTKRPRRRRTTVSLVIPAKTEAPNLPDVLGRIPNSVDEVILVDGQSTDVTLLMATSCRPDIRIVHERRPGKGLALQAGFHAATGDVVVAMDADGSMMPDEIPNYVHFLKNGYDFVKGSRFVGGGGSFDITKVRYEDIQRSAIMAAPAAE